MSDTGSQWNDAERVFVDLRKGAGAELLPSLAPVSRRWEILESQKEVGSLTLLSCLFFL